MSRWKAAGVHLGISALIAAVVLAVFYLLWYPSTYFTAMGGDQLILVLIGVDVVIGPLITLIIFKAGKKGLKFDLSVIAVLQFAALAFGVTIAAEARPVFTVFTGNRFDVVAANGFDEAELAKVTRPEYKSFSWFGPRVVGFAKPEDPKEANRIMFAMFEGKELQHFPQHYVPYSEVAAEAWKKAKPIGDLRRMNAERSGEIDAFLKQKGLAENEAGFLPLRGRRGDRTVILRNNGDIVATLDLVPW